MIRVIALSLVLVLGSVSSVQAPYSNHKKVAVTTRAKSLPRKVKPKVVAPPPKIEEPAWITGEATAYYNGKDRMNGESGVTASGYSLDNGIMFKGRRILASDKSIPLGTIVEISVGGTVITGVVLDRGGRITANKFDIVMSSKQECFNFGRQPMKYRIIGKVEL